MGVHVLSAHAVLRPVSQVMAGTLIAPSARILVPVRGYESGMWKNIPPVWQVSPATHRPAMTSGSVSFEVIRFWLATIR